MGCRAAGVRHCGESSHLTEASPAPRSPLPAHPSSLIPSPLAPNYSRGPPAADSTASALFCPAVGLGEGGGVAKRGGAAIIPKVHIKEKR